LARQLEKRCLHAELADHVALISVVAMMAVVCELVIPGVEGKKYLAK
jgi:hypothetical protein